MFSSPAKITLASLPKIKSSIYLLGSNRMKTFQIYEHPTFKLEVVKVGFNWPAFCFGILWMLFCRLWDKALLWLCLSIAINVIGAVIDTSSDEELQAVSYVILLGAYTCLLLIPGFQGNSWRSGNLRNRGYQLVNTVQAPTRDAAIAEASRQSHP